MKKLLSTLLALLMLLACIPACADGSSALSAMPAAIQSYMAAKKVGNQYQTLDYLRPGQGNYAFVAASDGKDNRLLCFRLADGEWKYQWNRTSPMPDVKYEAELRDLSGLTYNGMQLGTAFSIREVSPTPRECIYELEGSIWRLRMVCLHDTDDTILDTYRVESGVVKYEGWRKNGQQRIYGTLQTDLRYFSWHDFPFFDVDGLRSIMSNPPSIPEGTLTAKRIQFTGGKKYPVYNGPGTEYGQSGDGKAHVSTNDWIQVFGEEDGWIMIQYDITRDHMRIGWINADALPASASVRTLSFTPIPSRMTAGTSATDDPLGTQDAAFYLRAGVSVQWLATMGDWAYVESTDGSLMRGFVPLARISADSEWEK